MTMRINQYIAKSKGISRRKADEAIKSSFVKVNGDLAQLQYYVQTDDLIEYYDGKKWTNVAPHNENNTVLLLYKPKKVVTTHFDPEGRKTIYSLIPKEFDGYKSAGRLDYMSEGLIVLSQNGNFILSLTHPKFKTSKKYLVGLSKPLNHSQIQDASSGTMEIDGYKLNPVIISKARIDDYSYLRLEKNLFWYSFELKEGRNRQIRKMMGEYNNPVKRLIRVAHGHYTLSPEILKKGYSMSTVLNHL